MTPHGRPTDHANQNLAELHRKVIRQQADGMIIWQPRVSCWFADKQFAGTPLPDPYEKMSLPDIFRSLHCSDRLYQFNSSIQRAEDPKVVVRENRLNETDIETIWETPVGKQRAIRRTAPTTWYYERIKGEIASEEDMKVAIWRAERATYTWDQDYYETQLAAVGDLGLPTVFMPRVNVQDLYINTMGIQEGIMAIYDYPDTVEAYFRALDGLDDRYIELINASPIEVINFGDNVHASTLSPDLFLKYVLPAYQRRCEKLHAADKFVHAHWDGDTRALLPYARETGLDGIEAITPQPQGDVTLEEAKEALGDDMFLLDGIPAVFFDETYSVETLAECAEKVIHLFAPKLILGISDEISSTGDIERVRVVGKIVDDYNAKVAAQAEAKRR